MKLAHGEAMRLNHEYIGVEHLLLGLIRESEGMGTAYVSTAVELTKEQKQAVREKLLQTTSYQSFDVYYHVDPTLIGGMVIRVGDRVVDSSIRTKLEDMKKQLLNIQLG